MKHSHFIVACILVIGIGLAIGLAAGDRRPTRDCGRLSLEQIQAAGMRPGDCAVMPKNRNGG